MYQYDDVDQAVVEERALQFRGHVARRIDGAISEAEFKPLRLQNGLYMQLHSYMLRVAIPYGLLSSTQLRGLARISERFDRSYGHFTTRQNIQFNWVDLVDVPDLLDELSAIQMHAIQTSGNCIRNVTSDPFAGVAADEEIDPRPYCELLRQWSTFHPEFANLPRKFKIAVTGASEDRAAVYFHDIGLKVWVNDDGEPRFTVIVGGGQGRTPIIGKVVCEELPESRLLSYLESILRVYNRFGRRDNKYKARIKILVSDLGVTEFGRLVLEDEALSNTEVLKVNESVMASYRARFSQPIYHAGDGTLDDWDADRVLDRDFDRWLRNNTFEHRQMGHRIVMVTLKETGLPPGDATAEMMDGMAEVSDEFSGGRLVVTHRQNLVLPDVRIEALKLLWKRLRSIGLGHANANRATDTIACPGLDYCNLANARSIDIATAIEARLTTIDDQVELGPLNINISGCINACGHHHVGHIGVLGINKLGSEFYQLMLGGHRGFDASLGKLVGPAFGRDVIVEAVAALAEAYVELRDDAEETFIETYRRVGLEPFKEALYGANQGSDSLRRRMGGVLAQRRRSA